MFKLSIQSGGLEGIFGIDGTYRLVAEAGFDAIDANLNNILKAERIRKKETCPAFRPELSTKEMLEYFRPWKDAAEKYHLVHEQTHAIFPSCLPVPGDGDYDEYLFEALKKCIRAARYVHSDKIVIHPFYRDYAHLLSREEARELNIGRLSRLAPVAREEGVTICLENMQSVGHNGKRFGDMLNNFHDAKDYVDTLNDLAGSEVFGFCLDTGHANIAGVDSCHFIMELGNRLKCFHVHDNDGIDDKHAVPFTGTFDWDRLVETLAKIRYKGYIDFEVFRSVTKVPKELVPYVLKYTERCGRYFDQKASLLSGEAPEEA